MEKIKTLVVIEDFAKPETCWDCPILKTHMGDMYCGFKGKRDGIIRTYKEGFIRDDCKLTELSFVETIDEEDSQ